MELVLDSSKINDFLKCPRYYMYRHYLGWQSETISNHLIFGSAVHVALEHLLLNGYDNNSIMGAFDLFLAEYRKTFSESQDEIFEPKTPQNFFHILNAYANNYKRDLENFEVLYTEIAGTVAINGVDSIALRMDSILKDRKSGKVFSLEHKTASSTYLWSQQWLLSIQVGTYTHALNCLFGQNEVDCVTMNGLFISKAKNSWKDINSTGRTKNKLPWEFIREPIAKSKDQMQVWLSRVNWLYDEIKYHTSMAGGDDARNGEVLGYFPLNSQACSDYGKLCIFHPFCIAWPNPLKRCDDVPIGFVKEFWDPLAKEAKKTIAI